MKNEYTRLDMVPLYSATELEELTGIDRRRIPFYKTRFLPIKVSSGSAKKSKKWYSIKYVDYKDVKVYMIYARKDVDNKNTKTKGRPKLRKKDLQK